MAQRDDMVGWMNEYLDAEGFDDYCPNGLQIEGVSEVRRVVVGVSASQALFQTCHKEDAQMVIVHHGLIWKSLPRVIRGVFKDRLAFLLKHGISLVGYHLPLDAHPTIGNNILLAQALELDDLKPFGSHGGKPIGRHGRLAAEMPRSALLTRIERILDGPVLHFDDGPGRVSRIGIVSGGAADDLHDAIDLGLDLFLTGEAGEPTYEMCREGRINFVAGGHYRTERLGIQALGEELHRRFGVPVTFFDSPNPV